MRKEIELTLSPEEAGTPALLRQRCLHFLKVSDAPDLHILVLRKSIDARGRTVRVHIVARVYRASEPESLTPKALIYPDVYSAPSAIVIGAGPAGMFAALRLIEHGIKPILLERGQDVRNRVKDIADISRRHRVNPESNFCFGEGGAGTFSDGKLYTRSKKRGDWKRILEIFVRHGASENILIDTHPHIGTNKLPKIIAAMREQIKAVGGEVHFNTKVTDFILKDSEIKGVISEKGEQWEGIGVILATGHSSRDMYHLLHEKNIYIEAKPFALGVRAEHRQSFIDQSQYHCERGEFLPASPYSLTSQVLFKGEQRGVFSFCMCPGGFIVPSATSSGEVVVNGMSPSQRNSRYANSGIVVSVDERDFAPYAKYGALSGLYYQMEIEKRACIQGGGTQTAPAQMLRDFVKDKVSSSLIDTSYQPGVHSVDLRAVLPANIAGYLKEGFKAFDKKIKGFTQADAILLGVESRTSSPVRIPRNPTTLEHVQIRRLYPCGEGGGFAGGIASAAIDGEKCADQLAYTYSNSRLSPLPEN